MSIELPYRPPVDVLPSGSSYKSWIEGGLRKNPLNHELTRYAIALPCACIKTDSLDPDTWRYEKVGDGYLVAHKDFLAIQDDFIRFEPDLSYLNWNGQKAYDTLHKYLSRVSQGKQGVRKIFYDSLSHLSPELRDEIEHEGKNYITDLIPPSLVAIPDPDSYPHLWTDFYGFPPDYNLEVKFAKISEEGRILASRRYRDERIGPEFRGHDYFSYAARFVRSGQASSIEDKLLNGTYKHEVNHDVSDYLSGNVFMALPDGNPISEGYVGMLGNDGREYQKIPFETTIDMLFQTPILGYTQGSWDKNQGYLSYYAFPRVFRCIEQILTERYANEHMSLVKLNAGILQTSYLLRREAAENPLDAKRMSRRVSLFFNQLVEHLQIYQSDLRKKYEDLSAISA